MTGLADEQRIAPSFYDGWKRVLLGKPMITDELQHEKLSNTVALGALSPDAISSTAYGPEQIMVELLPAAGMAAFVLLLPLVAVILLILVLVTASYRQVVMTYTRAGGSYIVARENFGPRVAQIAAAALLIDYVVTVAIQCAAGTVAVASAIPTLGPYSLEISVAAVLIFCYANLRGLREAGRTFAVPTYWFIGMLTLMIVVGVAREIFGNLPQYDPQHLDGAVPVHQGSGLVMGATILIILRAFANGGSSLTGVEAISNTVNLFRKPEGPNARRVLTIMAAILGLLLAGVAWLGYATHSVPFSAGYPSMLSEIGRAVFGHGLIGNVFFFLLQAASAAILYNGANTSFNGFPALTHFVAEDRFLPRPLMKRGHRLVFSNAIILLTTLAVVLLIATGGSVNALVPMFAMGVFTAFSMAGYGMTKHHLTHHGPGWRYKLVINLSAGILSTSVVGIFAIAKFTEGAWLVVVVFPIFGAGVDAPQPAVSRRGVRVGDVARRASRSGQTRPASGLRVCRQHRPGRDRGDALRAGAACRRIDRGALCAGRGSRRASAGELAAFRARHRAAHGPVPGSQLEPGRPRPGFVGQAGAPGHHGDRAVAAPNLLGAAGPAAA